MINEVIQRLKDTVPALKLVEGAAGFQAAVESNPKVTPCVFVIPLEETPGQSVDAPVVIQNVRTKIGVVFVVRNLTDAKGLAAKVDLDALRNATKAQLLGWQPQAGYDPLERGPGGLLAFRDGHMWWQDIYQSSYVDRSVL
ncbi:hypothetical protein [Herbaspirillum sp. ST 5-3]|uniref:phage tail terminator protein n=1 Tax=Oxalobacteraceae TaxID=75682 RepID=UPI0010A2F100|nr:hypothetical protein [Herbaspirillum sp. ST 5-3]